MYMKKNSVVIKKEDFPKPRFKWMRSPVTKVKDNAKGYSRAREKAKARRLMNGK